MKKTPLYFLLPVGRLSWISFTLLKVDIVYPAEIQFHPLFSKEHILFKNNASKVRSTFAAINPSFCKLGLLSGTLLNSFFIILTKNSIIP